MPASFMKKTMAYLGLVDDDYDEYDEYEARTAALAGRAPQRPLAVDEFEEAPVAANPRIRTLTPDTGGAVTGPVAAVAARPPTPSVRPISQDQGGGARVHIVAPGRFADAQEIANRLMNNQPVIVNMQSAERDLQRRMIDFCSGATYALSGGMGAWPTRCSSSRPRTSRSPTRSASGWPTGVW